MVPIPIFRCTGEVVCEADIADRFLSRLVGLMGKRAADCKSPLLLTRTSSIHTFFMRFPIDVVHLDRQGRVLAVQSALAPWQLGRFVKRTRHILELRPGEAAKAGIVPGDTLLWMRLG